MSKNNYFRNTVVCRITPPNIDNRSECSLFKNALKFVTKIYVNDWWKSTAEICEFVARVSVKINYETIL